MALLDQTQRRAGERSANRRAERYRTAAENALGQLDWTIGYLDRIRKSEVSRALAKNRNQIRRSMRRTNEM